MLDEREIFEGPFEDDAIAPLRMKLLGIIANFLDHLPGRLSGRWH